MCGVFMIENKKLVNKDYKRMTKHSIGQPNAHAKVLNSPSTHSTNILGIASLN